MNFCPGIKIYYTLFISFSKHNTFSFIEVDVPALRAALQKRGAITDIEQIP